MLWAGFYVLGAAILWSTIGVVSVLGGDAILMAFTRSFIAGLAGLLVYRGFSKPPIIAGILLGVLFSSYPVAAILASVGTAAYLLYTAPLWSTIASRVLGERPSSIDIGGVTLILAAVALMGLDAKAGNITMAGYAAGLLSGLSYGLYIAVARYYSVRGKHLEISWAAMPYTMLITTPMVIAYYFSKEGFQEILNPVIAGVYMAFFATLLPYALFVRGVERIGAAPASIIATAEPVLAAVWGYLFFNQIPSPLTFTAYVIITASLIITSLQYRRRSE